MSFYGRVSLRHLRCLGSALLSVPLILLGCASAIEAARATERFKTLFDCPAANTEAEFGGYRVEGCGRIAHFRCFETDHDHDDEHKRLGEVLVESMIEGALVPETCVLEYAETEKPPTPEPALRIVPNSTYDKEAVASARMFVLGGYITALGRPAKHPYHVLLTVRSAAPFASEPCTTRLLRDGVSIVADETLRVNDNELLVVVRAAALRGAERAQQFEGTACGFSFQLDDSARKELGAFEVRFRRASLRKKPQYRPAATPADARAAGSANADSWDPTASKLVLTWVAHPFPNDEQAQKSGQPPARQVELAVRAGTTLKRIRLAPSLGTLHPEGASLCSSKKPQDRWWVTFDHGGFESYTARIVEPGHLSIQSAHLTGASCGDAPCPEQELGSADLEVPQLPIEERIRVVPSKGEERDFSCQTGEFGPEGH